MKRKIHHIPECELVKLSTKRLLARLKRLHECEESLELSDRSEAGNDGVIEFKQTIEWVQEYNYIKDILATREHIKR